MNSIPRVDEVPAPDHVARVDGRGLEAADALRDGELLRHVVAEEVRLPVVEEAVDLLPHLLALLEVERALALQDERVELRLADTRVVRALDLRLAPLAGPDLLGIALERRHPGEVAAVEVALAHPLEEGRPLVLDDLDADRLLSFDAQAMEIVNTVAGASAEMRSTAEAMSATADQTSSQTTAVAVKYIDLAEIKAKAQQRIDEEKAKLKQQADDRIESEKQQLEDKLMDRFR